MKTGPTTTSWIIGVVVAIVMFLFLVLAFYFVGQLTGGGSAEQVETK